MLGLHEVFDTKKVISTFFMITGAHRTKETIVCAGRLDTKPGDRLVKMVSVLTGDLHNFLRNLKI